MNTTTLEEPQLSLSELRTSHKVGLREIARRMKTSHPAVSYFEENGTGNLETVESYAAALHVDFDTVHKASLVTRRRKSS